MKTLYTVIISVFFITKILGSGLEDIFETTYRSAINENLAFLSDKFPNKPGKGYPWVTVTINGKKAILICPEDGLGDALLVFENGKVKRKSARSEGSRLSYHTTVQPLNGEKWHEFNSDNGWEDLDIKNDTKFAENVAKHFTNEFLKAVYKVKVEK